MSEFPTIPLPPDAKVGDEVVVSSEANGAVWSVAVTNKAKTRRRFRCVKAGKPPVVVPPVEPPPVPPDRPAMLQGFGAGAKVGTGFVLVRNTAELLAAVKVPGSLIGFDGNLTIDHPGFTLAEGVLLDGGMHTTLRGGTIWGNNHTIIRRTRLHFRGTGEASGDIISFKFGKHDFIVSQCDIVAFKGTGEPDGWTDATRDCFNGTFEFNRYIGIPGYSHNLQVLLSNGTKQISWHHNHVIDGGERLPAGLPGDSGGAMPGPSETTFDSVGNVIDGCDSYAFVCQDGCHANDRWNTYNAPSRAPATSWAFDCEAADSRAYSIGSEVNGKPYSVAQDTPESAVSTPFPAPDVTYGLTTIEAHRALTLAHAGVRPLDAVAAAAMARWNRT